MRDADLTLLLEIARDPDDCLLNHKVSKAALKRLMAEDLILVETRRMSVWHTEPHTIGMSNAERLHFYETVWAKRRALPWKNRSEVHARLTPAGLDWVAEFRMTENRVLHSA